MGNFFSHIALFASSLWPVPFGLSWLDFRFGAVDLILPTIGAVGTAFSFIPAYILARVLFSKIKVRLPIFFRIKTMTDEVEYGEELFSYTDVPQFGKAIQSKT
ncbi:MAG: hypothetical protein K9L30_15970 [Desulfobacterales bacterium]|nr:hypothetical protein [Desulfobacterales bacterium]